MGRRIEYQLKGGDALRLGSKGSYIWFVCGWQVKLCDPLVTHGPYMSAVKIRSLYIRRYINSAVLLFTLLYDKTRNTFYGTCHMPHSQVCNDRTVPIIMAGCIAHTRNGHISTWALKSDVAIVFSAIVGRFRRHSSDL